MSIIHKFSLMMAIVLVAIVIVGVSTLFLVEDNIKTFIITETTNFIEHEVSYLDRDFYGYITLIKTFIHQENILELVNKSNIAYDTMKDPQVYIDDIDTDWVANKTKSATLFMEMMNHELSREINKMVVLKNDGDPHGACNEVFITNRFGAVIGLSNKTTDFRQDDEEWWQQAKENGMYISTLVYDDSTKAWQIVVAVALHLADKTFAGVIKVGISMEWIVAKFGERLGHIFKQDAQENFHWYLFTMDGRVFYSSEPFSFLQQAPPDIDIEQIKRMGSGVLGTNDHQHTDVFAISKGVEQFPQTNWILLLRHENNYLFSTSNTIKMQIMLAMLIVIVISTWFGVKIWLYLKLYTNKISTWSHEISHGNFDIDLDISSHDELGKLARILCNMITNLEMITVSRDKLQLEIQEKIKIDNLLRKERDFNALILNSTADGIYGIDDSGQCIFINYSGLILLGFSTTEEIIGKKIHELIHHSYVNGTPYPELACPVCRPMGKNQQVLVTDDVFWRQDKSNFPVEYSAHTMYQDNLHVGTVAIFRDISERKSYENRLQHAANYDFLTGLPNRYLFSQLLSHALRQTDRLKTLLAVIFLDIDHFKHVNETFGHTLGDRLLQMVAATFAEYVRSSDIIARFASDEFVLLCENFHCVEQIDIFANHLIHKFREHSFNVNGVPFHITASLGIAIYPFTNDAEKLLQHADIAIYHAKKMGGNCYKYFFWEMQDEISRHVQIDKALHIALQQHEFQLVFQPKQNLAQGHLVGMEVLVRLNSSVIGPISPTIFIPIAEKTGYILEISKWILRTACEKFVSWPTELTSSLIMSVNISASQIQDENFFMFMEQVLRETGMPKHSLELEITEGTIMNNTSMINPLLQAIRAQGIKIAIDDFGTGYSSLGYLKYLPIDILKIDRAFVCNLTTNKNDQAIVGAIISMAHRLGLRVIAEGVEEEAHVMILRENDCDEIQGYFYSKPLPEEEFKNFCLGAMRAPGREI